MRTMVIPGATRAPAAGRRLVGCVLAFLAATALAQEPVDHALTVTLAPDTEHIEVRDRITLPAGSPQPRRFALNAGLTVRVEDHGAELTELDEPSAAKNLRHYALTLAPGERSVTLRYHGRLNAGDGVTEPAVNAISAAGVFLDETSGWYPAFGDARVRFRLTAQLPTGWDAVSQGRGGRVTRSAQGTTVTWEERAPQLGIYLVAARFERYLATVPWGEAAVYLRAPNARLAETYLAATRRYVELYSSLLGAYPYAKFALVENFRQTGLGMPSFTLLGSQVIRLPFIPETSFRHEILHNWWGNGVYVDPSDGNWSEGLTTYLADHLQAEGAGRDVVYRRDALARYANFARGVRDFALKDFHGRHDEATQAVGYGKGLMFFHMLRVQLGDAAFLAGLRAFYARHRFERAGFAALRAAMEAASGRKLDDFFRQWHERIGAPQLELAGVTLSRSDGRYHVRGELKQVQRDWAYQLRVPLVLERAGLPPFETTLHMPTKTLRFDITMDDRPLRLAIDPRFDVFRRPAPAELPASLGETFGADQVTFVLPAAAARDARAAYAALAQNWQRAGATTRSDGELAALPAHGAVVLFGWDNRWRAALAKEAGDVQITNDAVAVGAQRYARRTHGVALALRHAGHALVWIAAEEPDTIARLGRALSHYQGMSYVFMPNDASTRARAGQWEVGHSPLQWVLAPDVPATLALPRRPSLTEAAR
jgi:hypothetical protein